MNENELNPEDETTSSPATKEEPSSDAPTTVTASARPVLDADPPPDGPKNPTT